MAVRHFSAIRLAALAFATVGVLLATACTQGQANLPYGWSGPAVSNGVIYAAIKGGRIVVMDRDGGAILSRFPGASDKRTPLGAYGDPVLKDGVLYFGAFNGKVYALKQPTKDELDEQRKLSGNRDREVPGLQSLWEYPAGDTNPEHRIVSGIAVTDDAVFFGATDKKLHAVDAAKGQTELWRPFETGGEIWSTPAVADGVVYVGSQDHNLYAVDAKTGKELWRFETQGPVIASPVVVDGVVYVGSFDKRFYAIDTTSHQKLWDFEGSNWFWSRPLVANGVVYVGGLDHKLYARDAKSGAEVWTNESPNGPIRSTPVIAGDLVIVGTDEKKVYAVDKTSGAFRWYYETNGAVAGPLFYDGERVVFSSLDGNNTVYVLNPASSQGPGYTTYK